MNLTVAFTIGLPMHLTTSQPFFRTGMIKWRLGVRGLSPAKDFALHSAQTGSGDKPALYQLGV
jgi:hypothetical protein